MRDSGIRRVRHIAVTLALMLAAGVVVASAAGAPTGGRAPAGTGDRAVAASATGASGTSGDTTASTGASGATLGPLLGPPPIVKDMIPFGAVRKNQMRAYALLHYGIDSYKMPHPHLVIWHYTETSTFSSVWNTFANDVPDVEYHALPQVCAQFVIDQAGTIYQLVPIHIMCRQVVGLDYTAVGIENVGFSDQQVMGDAAQFHAGLELTRWLRCTLDIPVRNVIGHNESLSSPYYIEHVASWRGQTHEDFDHADMNIVRARVTELPCRAPSP